MNKVKRIPTSLEIKEFLVTFSYETRKGRYKEQQRTIKAIDKEIAKNIFKEWSKTIRTMSNVEILGIDELEHNREVIEL